LTNIDASLAETKN